MAELIDLKKQELLSITAALSTALFVLGFIGAAVLAVYKHWWEAGLLAVGIFYFRNKMEDWLDSYSS